MEREETPEFEGAVLGADTAPASICVSVVGAWGGPRLTLRSCKL